MLLCGFAILLMCNINLQPMSYRISDRILNLKPLLLVLLYKAKDYVATLNIMNG
jgi:hypothetical protein